MQKFFFFNVSNITYLFRCTIFKYKFRLTYTAIRRTPEYARKWFHSLFLEHKPIKIRFSLQIMLKPELEILSSTSPYFLNRVSVFYQF